MMQSNWSTPKTVPKLGNSEIHIWRALTTNFTYKIEYYWKMLSQAEQQKAKKFVQPIHKERFIIIHGILRQLLAAYLNIAPDKIEFIDNEFGKPQIAKSDKLNNKTINFNISHSQDVALFAFTENFAIGVDVEFKRQNIEIEEIAKRFFTSKENDTLTPLPPEQKSEKFFTYWTCKEAFIKAIGKGLSYPLNNFEIDINTFKLNINDPQYQNIDWSLIKLDAFSDFAAAVVIAGNISKINFFDFL